MLVSRVIIVGDGWSISACSNFLDKYLFIPEISACTVYPKNYAHGFVVLCFVVVMQSFIMNSHEVFIHIHQGCFAGTGAIVRLPQCQWSKPDGYGRISQCITTTKHSNAKTVCIFLGIYCILYNRITMVILIPEQIWFIYFVFLWQKPNELAQDRHCDDIDKRKKKMACLFQKKNIDEYADITK